jgi:phosphoribosyl-dephospho-CoA transferase
MKSSEPKVLRRHRFVWFADVGNLFDLAAGETPQADLASLRKWVGIGRPLIVRRPCVAENGNSVCVGLALPPDPVKRRLAFRLPVSCITIIADPPPWGLCKATAAFDVVNRVESIQSATAASGLSLLTFGSHAWQYHTVLSYVTPNSDIDFLIPINRRDSWKKFQQSMAEVDIRANRTDVEIVLNGDASFSWREFESSGTQMLFKGNRSVWMGAKSDVEGFLHE